MSNDKYILLLKDSLEKLQDAKKWLMRSYDICKVIDTNKDLTEEEFDAFETLTSRFSRTSDMILQKLFRNIDKLEIEEGGTLLDALNRAEKRRIIESVDKFREIRELRNEIAHEYALDDLTQLFRSVVNYTPELFQIIQNISNYCQRYTPDH